MDGVSKHQTRQPNILIVAFDDEKTNMNSIRQALKEGTFFVQGKPVYLKAFPSGSQSN